MRWLALALLIGCAHAKPALVTACPTKFIKVKVHQLEGEPASLFWSARRNALLIADSHDSRIWQWDEHGAVLLGELPSEGRNSLGQLIELEDGRILVTRFGFGDYGAIVYLDPDGTSGVLPDLDRKRRRIGLARYHDDIVTTSFTTGEMGPVGVVSRIDDSELAGGFGKTVGVLQVGNELYVSDQTRAQLIALPSRRVVATLPNADLLAPGPLDSVFSGQYRLRDTRPSVRQICADGSVHEFDTKLTKPAGVAYDPIGKRVFVTDAAQLRVYSLP